jgi:cytochrome c-type biogenesis protein CcmF
VLVLLALLLAAAASLAIGFTLRRRGPTRAGLWLACAGALVALCATGTLVTALLVGDTGFLYVLQHWDSDLSPAYRVAALWAGAEGSLLLWVTLLTAATGIIAATALRVGRRRAGAAGDGDPLLHEGAVLVLTCVAIFLVALLAFDAGSDPFSSAPVPAPTPTGLDPLLLHPAMALHPPALFLGYVGLAVPFAYALAALVSGRLTESWVLRSRAWALGGWVFLSLGIGLGAWWAYVILSWGGYWGWDPVENASLVPWLTATALLHSMHVYRRDAALRRWTTVLAPLTFWLTIVAAWTTRTGAISSVHAFAQRDLLLLVLTTLLGVVAAVTTVLLVVRWKALGDRQGLVDGTSIDGAGAAPTHAAPSALGRRGVMYVLLDAALATLALTLAFTTVIAPLALGQTVRPQTYEALARPLGMLVVLGVGLCPLLGRSGEGLRPLAERLAAPVAVAAIVVVGLAAVGWASRPLGLAGLAVCAFTATATLAWCRPRTIRGPAGVAVAGRSIAALRRCHWGAALVHIGLAVLVAGLIGAGMYRDRAQLELPPESGAVASIGDVRLTIAGLDVAPVAQGGERVAIRFDVERDGRSRGSVAPAIDYYAEDGQTVPRADILGLAWQDVFVSPLSFGTDGIVVEVIVFPLVRFIWAGSALLVIGGLVALWPCRRRAAAGSRAPAHKGVPDDARTAVAAQKEPAAPRREAAPGGLDAPSVVATPADAVRPAGADSREGSP